MFDYSADAIAELDPYVDPDGVAVFLEHVVGGPDGYSDLGEALAAYEDAVIGDHYESVEDYAYEYAEDCLGLEGFALDYFDAERFARDLTLGGDIVEVRNADTGYKLWLFHGNW